MPDLNVVSCSKLTPGTPAFTSQRATACRAGRGAKITRIVIWVPSPSMHKSRTLPDFSASFLNVLNVLLDATSQQRTSAAAGVSPGGRTFHACARCYLKRIPIREQKSASVLGCSLPSTCQPRAPLLRCAPYSTTFTFFALTSFRSLPAVRS